MKHIDLVQQQAKKIKELVKRYGAANVRVFGSSVHQKDLVSSDIDLLVDWKQSHSLLDHIGLQQDLEDLLHTKVDLVTSESLHWYVRDRILNEAMAL